MWEALWYGLCRQACIKIRAIINSAAEVPFGAPGMRSWHAVGRVLITRSDSGKAQPNISELGGAAAAAAISGERAKSWQCGECVDHTDGMGFAYVYD